MSVRRLLERLSAVPLPGAVASRRPLRRRPLAGAVDAVAPLVPLAGRKLRVVDVGARWGASGMWEPFGSDVIVWGFDPDADECRRLQSLVPPGLDRRYVPLALGAADETRTLHVATEPGSSSLFPPREDLASSRPALWSITPVRTAQVQLRTLDGWAASEGVTDVDVLKLDVQGAELAVLEGGEQTLRGVRALEIEVEFNEIYDGQPLFGDIDRHLRERGFVLWRLGNLVHYGIAGAHPRFTLPDTMVFDTRRRRVAAEGGQVFWGHAYYVPQALAAGRDGHWTEHLLDAAAVSAFGWRDLATPSLQ